MSQINTIYILLILFFTSLMFMLIMVHKKLNFIEEQKDKKEGILELELLTEIKNLIFKKIKNYSHVSLVSSIRYYVKSKNFIKGKYEEIKDKMMDVNKKTIQPMEKRQASNFLKKISEYKEKIRELKEKIHEEEKNM